MFPWVYGFTWDAGNIIFLGLFFTVVTVIAGTVALASLRAYQHHRSRKHEAIRWQADFHDLPRTARTCRHELTGELKQRTCPNGFDCRVCDMHVRLLEKAPTASRFDERSARQPTPASPFDIPLDRLYHRGHTWVQLDADGVATIGLDDFCSRVFGTPEQVEFPPVGSQIHVNGEGWKMRRDRSAIRILSPVDGQVMATGGAEQGWFLKVRPLGPAIDIRHLLHGDEVRLWIAREMDRLQMSLGGSTLAPTLADGGEPVKDFPRSMPSADWDGIWGELFLEP